MASSMLVTCSLGTPNASLSLYLFPFLSLNKYNSNARYLEKPFFPAEGGQNIIPMQGTWKNFYPAEGGTVKLLGTLPCG